MKKPMMLMMVVMMVGNVFGLEIGGLGAEEYGGIIGKEVEEKRMELAPDWVIEMWKGDGEYTEKKNYFYEITSSEWYLKRFGALVGISDGDMREEEYSELLEEEKEAEERLGYNFVDGESGNNYYWGIYLNEDLTRIAVDLGREVEAENGKKKDVKVTLVTNIPIGWHESIDAIKWLRSSIWRGEETFRYKLMLENLYWTLTDEQGVDVAVEDF